ncbi:pumilio homolog 12-like isoform X2 [Punica granatum]|uniref:Pumilio homolog 12-like isoform X2 n=1 Tax=Punica granatum TaxID=22663 RepID=A0A6P8DAZ1_PUNGR|nr:pumilio homolog 12-like isoform X2 [Punica granatum]
MDSKTLKRMAQGRHEQGIDELNTLLFLGEMPNATLGQQRCEESVLTRLTSGDPPGNFNIMNNGFQQNHFEGLPMETVELIDDRVLSSAFAELNLRDGLAMEALPFTNCIQNTERQRSTLFSVQSQSSSPCVFNELNGTNAGLQNAENYINAAGLMNNGIRFVSHLPCPADTQSSPPYLHPQHVNQSQFTRRNIEEEQLDKMLKQRHLYLHWLQSHHLDTQNLIHANSNFVPGLMNQNQGQFFQSNGSPQQLDQWSLGLPHGDLDSVQVLDKISRQSCPMKILKRSNGLSTLRAMKLGPVRGNDSLNSVIQSGKFIDNGQVRYNSCNSDHGSFQLGSLRESCGQFSNINGLRGADMAPLPLEYGHVNEVRGCIYRLAKDQNGCRYLQRKFSEGSPQEVETIFLEVLEHIADLMTDPFGNYLVQKLLQVCDENQTTQILRVITRKPGDLIRISCDMHGTRAVQKVLQTLKTQEQFSIALASLKPGMVTLMKNSNGNHVAQCCLEHFMPKYSKFLFEVAAENCVDLATDRHGCCVLQKCLGHPGGEQRLRLIYEIISNSLVISQNQYGNYVIQYVLLHIPAARPDVLEQLKGHYVELSMQKYSSNVVEKCIEYADEESHCRIIKELITSPELDRIMQDPYGNYVIQAALKSSRGAVKAAIVEAIKPYIHVLRSSPYGKKVLSSSCLKNLCPARRQDLVNSVDGVWGNFGFESWGF